MTEHILSLSYGKDSLACLGAIEELGWPLDRIVHAEVWATDTIPADLPPMVAFKAEADKIIKERWGIEVEHICAMKDGVKQTYEKIFYRVPKRKAGGNFSEDSVAGFPYQKGAWCNDRLKTNVLDSISRGGQVGQQSGASIAPESSREAFFNSPSAGGCKNVVQYLGIAADEPNRFHNFADTKKSPLVELGWDEAYCRKWCEENDLLSPIYTTATRGGCWFCHNQGVGQLRLLRRDYPELWALMLKWDKDSPVTFKPDGHTVHDFDRRFQLEDEGFIAPDDKLFRWAMLDDELNYRLF